MNIGIKDSININVKNNTNLPQNVNMLGGTSDPLAVAPHLLYEYDLSSENYIGTTVTLLVGTTLAPLATTPYSAPLIQNNIQGVLNVLNGFGIGNFQVNGNIIYVSNDFYIYKKLEVS